MGIDFLGGVLIVVLGIFVGIINILAGGGSNLILPLLMVLGIDPQVANATNRVGIWIQSVVGIRGFQRSGYLASDDLPLILLPTLIGGLCGAFCAAKLDVIVAWIPGLGDIAEASLIKIVLLGTMLIVAALMLFRPQTVLPDAGTPRRAAQTPSAFFWLWLAGVYGGFVQAGVGFVLITALTGSLRYDLVRANALKLVCTLAFTSVALIIFILQGQVLWLVGIILGIGNAIGAAIGVKCALTINKNLLRWILFTMTVCAVVAAVVF